MERNNQKYALVNLLALLVAGSVAFVVGQYANSLTGQIAAVFFGLGFLVALMSWFQMRLESNERIERLELEEMARSKTASTLFEAKVGEFFPAERARRQFERFFVPGFTVLLLLMATSGSILLWWRVARDTTTIPLERSLVAMALFGLLALILFLLGRFSATMVRLENNRFLRPSASYLLLGAYLCFVSALAIAGAQADYPLADHYTALALCGLLGLLALETLVALLLEIYRPRVKGKVQRPMYDSRLVGLLGQPESLLTTAAHTLDYQFGFKVSETWFYRFFFEKALAWLILLQVAVLAVSTCVVFVDPGEQVLIERFGRPLSEHTVLGPGAHLKLPWPIDRAYRFPTDQIQTVNVGFTPDENMAEQKTILWTVPHAQEENYLVANREEPTADESSSNDTRRVPPVSLLTVNIPVEFQIRDLYAWAYNYQDAPGLLKEIAEREVVRYLVCVDLNQIMSHGRAEAAEDLRDRIQRAVDAQNLGARILFVGLQGIHPPVGVAVDYERVVAAAHLKEARILGAQAYAVRTNALAGAQVFTVTNEEEIASLRIESSAFARAAAFTNQLLAFNAAPSVYVRRAYLQTFGRATASSPKYILLATNTADVLVFDLQSKIGEGLMNLTVAPTPQKNSQTHTQTMKRSPLIFTTGALLIALVVLLLVTFQVRQSQVAVVTTFGRVTRDNLGPGVHFKLPAPIQRAYVFDQRVRNYEDQFTQDYTSDNNNLLTMVYVGWRISDPKEFFPKFEGGSAAKAESQLNSIVRNAKSAVVGRHALADFVNADEKQLKFDAIEDEIKALVQTQLETNHWGMTIEFLGIKKLGLPESVVVAVFDQMRSKRDLLASRFQNEGEATAQRIRSQADREAGEMLVNANAEATRIRGRAEASAAASLAAFQQNPELEIYLLSLDSLEQSLKENATLVFDQKMPPFDLFQGFGTNRMTR